MANVPLLPMPVVPERRVRCMLSCMLRSRLRP